MGICRGLVYVTVAAAVGTVTLPLMIGAAILGIYVTGLSYVSKWNPGAHRTVATLIAGIALLDALLIVSRGFTAVAAATALGFPLTLYFQRWVRGT
jgi:4-hydroxybenzoate polyprenyltransferase